MLDSVRVTKLSKNEFVLATKNGEVVLLTLVIDIFGTTSQQMSLEWLGKCFSPSSIVSWSSNKPSEGEEDEEPYNFFLFAGSRSNDSLLMEIQSTKKRITKGPAT